MSRSNKLVGIKSRGYPERRNFCDLQVEGYFFKKCWDLYKIPAYLYFRLKKTTHPKWLNLFWRPFFRDVWVYHFFNAVNRGNQPWIVTFECFLPRGAHFYGKVPAENKYIDYVISRLAHPSCHKIIALSEFAKRYQEIYMDAYGQKRSEIISKIEVIHPSQKLHIHHISEKPAGREKIRFTLVGADFFRKGGMEVLRVFKEMLSISDDIELYIVSNLNFGDYASGTVLKDQEEALEILRESKNIHHFFSLPNADVIELLINSDIGLLPSYDETYGYTVLEAQSCGCPVITTSGGVFREINNDLCGWIIDVALTPEGTSIPRSPDDKKKFSGYVMTGLKRIIEEVRTNPELIHKKGAVAIERIKMNHDPEIAARRLKEIYDLVI